MARLRFGIDSLGKEILELVPAAPFAVASPPSLQEDGNGQDADVEGNKPYKGDNTIVMMEWERPYMRALVDALGITGAGAGGGVIQHMGTYIIARERVALDAGPSNAIFEFG